MPSRKSSFPFQLNLSKVELEYYSKLMNIADPQNTQLVSGKATVDLFKTSDLPVDVLKKIWSLATPNGETNLDRERFFVALKLVALAQEGRDLDLNALKRNEPTQLPRFKGVPLPQTNWEMTPEELSYYENGFAQLVGERSFLNTNEVKELLERTGLDQANLKKIWTISDPSKTGVLRKEQFLVAMHLISRVSQGAEVPDQLPEELQEILDRLKEPPKAFKPSEPLDQSFGNASQGSSISEPKEEPSKDDSKALNKLIEDKKKLLEEKKEFLDKIKDMLEHDKNELELFIEKNKQLEEKIKESQTNYPKMSQELIDLKVAFMNYLKQLKETPQQSSYREEPKPRVSFESIGTKPETKLETKPRVSFEDTDSKSQPKPQTKPKVSFEEVKPEAKPPVSFEEAKPKPPETKPPVSFDLEPKNEPPQSSFNFDFEPKNEPPQSSFNFDFETNESAPKSLQKGNKTPTYTSSSEEEKPNSKFTFDFNPEPKQTEGFNFDFKSEDLGFDPNFADPTKFSFDFENAPANQGAGPGVFEMDTSKIQQKSEPKKFSWE